MITPPELVTARTPAELQRELAALILSAEQAVRCLALSLESLADREHAAAPAFGIAVDLVDVLDSAAPWPATAVDRLALLVHFQKWWADVCGIFDSLKTALNAVTTQITAEHRTYFLAVARTQVLPLGEWMETISQAVESGINYSLEQQAEDVVH